MPNCLKCNNSFSKKIEIDGKIRNLQNRKYCFDCSPFNKHNTKQLDLLKRELNGEEICVCVSCNKRFIYKRKLGHTKEKCNSCITNDRRFDVYSRIYEYKGTKCVICGYNNCKRALHFHHVFSETKLFDIAGNYCRKWENVKSELDKCVILCANCHAEYHDGLIDIELLKKFI